jgi:hypothetical protein
VMTSDPTTTEQDTDEHEGQSWGEVNGEEW